MADKVDLKKTLKPYFSASKKGWEEVSFPAYRYLKVDGQGSPGDSPEYVAALEVLYPAAYGTKFLSKLELERDYVVPPLEGVWWADDMDAYTSSGRRDEWRWTLMLMLPEWIEEAHVSEALCRQAKKKPGLDFSQVRFEALEEGLCLQCLHLGPFADEAPVLHRLHHEVIPERGYTFNGNHHEIYLSDPRRTAPEKLRTILRQPVG
tara:strand:+ start:516 stop:1133 length:618 start_codon:yes stop_codon:yes gene_type:complete